MGGFYLWLKKPELRVEHPWYSLWTDRPSLGSCPRYRATASGTGMVDMGHQEWNPYGPCTIQPGPAGFLWVEGTGRLSSCGCLNANNFPPVALSLLCFSLFVSFIMLLSLPPPQPAPSLPIAQSLCCVFISTLQINSVCPGQFALLTGLGSLRPCGRFAELKIKPCRMRAAERLSTGYRRSLLTVSHPATSHPN